MREIVDIIYHRDGSRTVVYDNGSRELHLAPIDIEGRIPRAAVEPDDDAPPDLVPRAPVESGPPPVERGVSGPAAPPVAAGERETAPAQRGTRARARIRERQHDPDTAPPVARPIGPLGVPERVYPDILHGDRVRIDSLQADLVRRVRERLGRRTHLYAEEVFAIAEIRDRSGRNPRRIFAMRGPDGHAEQRLFRQLAPHMTDDRNRGGSLTMIVTQEPCGPSQVPVRRDFCQLEIRRFSRRHGLYTQVYVPVDPANMMRAVNPSFRRFLRAADAAAPLPMARSESDTWDDRAPAPPRSPPRRGPTPRPVVPPGPTQDDIEAARTRVALLGETQASVRRVSTFSRMLRVQTTILGGLSALSTFLETRHRADALARWGTFPERHVLAQGAQSWRDRGVEAARTARAESITTAQLDGLQGDINQAYNSFDGELLAGLASQLVDWVNALEAALAHLRRLEEGCRSASRSMAVATRMYRELTRAQVLDGFAQADSWVMWSSTDGLDLVYDNAATHYFYAAGDVERSLEVLRPLAADAAAASNNSFWRALREGWNASSR